MNEDKGMICAALTSVLKLTRAGSDVLFVEYDAERGRAALLLAGGGRKEVNVECDSGVALIVDVCRALM